MVLRRWCPERSPTWTDVIVGGLALFWVLLNLGYLQTIYWEWVVFGFVVGLLSMGPLANSPIGEQIGIWFRDIGIVGRSLFILSFAVAVWVVRSQVDISSQIVTSSVGGFMISMILYLLVYIHYSENIDGWK